MKTFHTVKQRTSGTTYRLTAGLNTLESRWDKKGRNRQDVGNIRTKTEELEVKLCREKFGRGKKGTMAIRCISKDKISKIIWLFACVPAEDCPLIFGIHGEPNGFLASPRGHGLCGYRLTVCKLSLAFFFITVRAVGRRAVRRHQWSFSCHTHTPHASCREWQRKKSSDLKIWSLITELWDWTTWLQDAKWIWLYNLIAHGLLSLVCSIYIQHLHVLLY